MSRKLSIMATVAVLGLSLFASTDADARGHFGGGFRGGGFKASHARISHGPVFRAKIGGFKRFGHRHHGFKKHVHKKHVHHHHHKKRYWSVKLRRFVWTYGVYAGGPVVSDAVRYSCVSDCDRLLTNGCYMAKRRFSTPDGDVLRCVKICD